MRNREQDASTQRRRVQDGDVVGYRYVMRGENGQVLAASAEVVRYVQGAVGHEPDALEASMLGREAGERFSTTLGPKDAFGARSGLRRLTLSRERFPALMELEAGKRIDTVTNAGEEVSVWVVEATDSEVVLDFDHPFAGRTLKFEVAVMSIRVATAEERSSGRAEPQHHAAADDARVRAQLANLRTLLDAQEDRNEGPEGLYADITANLDGADGGVAALRASHDALVHKLDAIVRRVEHEDAYDPQPALKHLVLELAQHDADESTLLQESLHRDEGGQG